MKRHHSCEHVLSTIYDQKRPPNLYIQQPTVYLLCVEEGLNLCKSGHRLFGWSHRSAPAQLGDKDSSMIRASVDTCSLLLSYSSSRGAQPRHPSGSWRHGGASSSWLSPTTHALCSCIDHLHSLGYRRFKFRQRADIDVCRLVVMVIWSWTSNVVNRG